MQIHSKKYWNKKNKGTLKTNVEKNRIIKNEMKKKWQVERSVHGNWFLNIERKNNDCTLRNWFRNDRFLLEIIIYIIFVNILTHILFM